MDDYQSERRQLKNRVRRRGIYLLPNLFTTAALFAGFYAIVQAMNVNFDHAAIAIFVAMVLDGLDGRVARMTRTQSAFGAEFDSLADMVSFGAAPALVMYEWVLRDLGKLGWIAAFVYVAGAALRLARFNTLLEVADKRWFTGLPSPSAAALVAGLVWVVDDLGYDPDALRWLAWAVTLFAGLTMVSNLKYYSFKTINLKKSVPFVAIFLIVLFLAVLAYQPPRRAVRDFVGYALSGYVRIDVDDAARPARSRNRRSLTKAPKALPGRVTMRHPDDAQATFGLRLMGKSANVHRMSSLPTAATAPTGARTRSRALLSAGLLLLLRPARR